MYNNGNDGNDGDNSNSNAYAAIDNLITARSTNQPDIVIEALKSVRDRIVNGEPVPESD